MARTRRQRQEAAAALDWPVGVRRASGRTGRAVSTQSTLPAQRRDVRHVRGAISELVACGLLMLKGYRIIDRRYRSRYGEIDIIAVRGRRLAFVEVKYRRFSEEAATCITGTQAARIANSAEQWVWRNPSYREYEIGLDAILVARGRLPQHLANALQPT